MQIDKLSEMYEMVSSVIWGTHQALAYSEYQIYQSCGAAQGLQNPSNLTVKRWKVE